MDSALSTILNRSLIAALVSGF